MDLSTTIAEIKLKNPLMPAAGPIVGDEEKMLYIARMGVGGMVTKTISTTGAQVPRPCIYGDHHSIMNAELWSEFHSKRWVEEILPVLKKDLDIPLMVSVGYTKEDMEELIPKLDTFADAFEISTHYVGKDLCLMGEIVKTIRKNTRKPIFMKMSPHIPEPIEFAKMVKTCGGDGIVAINSLGPTMKIDINKRKVLLGNKKGQVWTSGPVIKPLALGIVNMIKEAVPDLAVIGVGGICSPEDIIEFLLAGADAVQMLSGALMKGKDLYEQLVKDLPSTLNRYGFNSVQEVIDTRLEVGKVQFVPKHPSIIKSKCSGCKLCEKVCPYFAIKVDDEVHVDDEKCFGCGLCESRCPVGAIFGVL